MKLIPLEFCGIHHVGPEQFPCAILKVAGDNRVLPIWISDLAAEGIARVIEEEEPRRPSAQAVLAESLGNHEGGISDVILSNYHEGMFMASVIAGGREYDLKPSDALHVAVVADVALSVQEDVLAMAGVNIQPAEAKEYLGLELEDFSDAPSPEDFDEMLRNLGLDVDDLDS